jgi:hypothetical protein
MAPPGIDTGRKITAISATVTFPSAQTSPSNIALFVKMDIDVYNMCSLTRFPLHRVALDFIPTHMTPVGLTGFSDMAYTCSPVMYIIPFLYYTFRFPPTLSPFTKLRCTKSLIAHSEDDTPGLPSTPKTTTTLTQPLSSPRHPHHHPPP